MAVSNHLKIEHYILGRTIGIGAFGKVKCTPTSSPFIHLQIVSRHEFTGDTVAVKIISKQRMRKNNLNTRVNKEIQFLRYFNHPNIIKLYTPSMLSFKFVFKIRSPWNPNWHFPHHGIRIWWWTFRPDQPHEPGKFPIFHVIWTYL